ncbi:MAG: hypothetical protein K2N58_05845 [Treponemataceae bacterium]|nr:hypothetical protein [Treponemataceae bacterium]
MMMKNIQLPCGVRKDGNVVYIEDVENGKKCDCVCPGCGQPLVAKNNGKKKEHHFAHFRTAECEHGYQSALHYMAKDVFLEMKEFTFVKNGAPVKYRIDDVVLEKNVASVIPDILVTCDGKRFIVEIFVTHAVDDEKKEKIKALKLSALEIDLSRFRHTMLDKEALKTEVNNTDNFSWVYDADADLIEEKRNALQQFGLKIPIGVGYSVRCPFLWNQMNPLHKCVPLSFCRKCPHCYFDGKHNYIACATNLLFLPEQKERSKFLKMVFVNENKVMFASEFRQYAKNWNKNFQKAVNVQCRIFMNISRNLYVSPIYSYQYSPPPNHRPRRHYYNRYRRKR